MLLLFLCFLFHFFFWLPLFWWNTWLIVFASIYSKFQVAHRMHCTPQVITTKKLFLIRDHFCLWLWSMSWASGAQLCHIKSTLNITERFRVICVLRAMNWDMELWEIELWIVDLWGVARTYAAINLKSKENISLAAEILLLNSSTN